MPPIIETPVQREVHTVNSVLATYGFSRSMLYRYIKSGQVEAIKLGRRTFIPDSSVRALLANAPRLTT